MKFRWTMKELAEVSNHKFIETLITERKSTVDMGSPLDRKLVEVRAWHDKQEEVKADLLEACKMLADALIHVEGDTKGNKVRTAIIPLLKGAANKGRQAIAKAENN